MLQRNHSKDAANYSGRYAEAINDLLLDLLPLISRDEVSEVRHVTRCHHKLGSIQAQRQRLRRKNDVHVKRLSIRGRATFLTNICPKLCGTFQMIILQL